MLVYDATSRFLPYSSNIFDFMVYYQDCFSYPCTIALDKCRAEATKRKESSMCASSNSGDNATQVQGHNVFDVSGTIHVYNNL